MNVGFDFAILVLGYMAAAAVIDWRTHKIPNWLTVTSAVLGLAYHCVSPHGMGPLGSLAGFAVGFVLLLLPWMLGGGGMGDVKMLAALGAWLGPVLILIAFGLGAVTALMMALGVMASSVVSSGISRTQKQFITAGSPASVTGESRKARRVVPFAVPMAIATLLVVAWMFLRAYA